MSVFAQLRAVGDALEYLGKHSIGGQRVLAFLDKRRRIMAYVLTGDSGCLVQAQAKLALQEKQPDVDLSQLRLLLSSHNASFEVQTHKATRDLAERVHRPRRKSKWLEQVLRNAEEALKREKAGYERFRGVRDLGEAHEHLKRRNDEVFELGKDIVGSLQRPHFIHEPRRYHVSEWSRQDVRRWNELRYQSGQKASAIKQRIDFSRRMRIKDCEARVRDLKQELAEERKREKATEQRISALVEESVAYGLVLTIRSAAVAVRGRYSETVRQVMEEVDAERRGLRRKLEDEAGLRFQNASLPVLLAPIFVPPVIGTSMPWVQDLVASHKTSMGLAAKDDFGKQLQAMMERGLYAQSGTDALLDLSGFPTLAKADEKRLAYLGLGLTLQRRRTQAPVLMDIDAQLPRHVFVTGATGAGKSTAASIIAEGAILHGVPCVVFDPTGSWTGFAQACTQKQLLDLYPRFSMKPQWRTGFPMRVLDSRSKMDASSILEGRGVHVVTARSLTVDEEGEHVCKLLTALYEEIQAWPDSQKLKALLAFDECHRYAGDKRVLPVLELFVRTARAKGVGVILASQSWVDIPPVLRANVSTHVCMGTQNDRDLQRAAKVLGNDYRDVITKLPPGQAVYQHAGQGTCLLGVRPPLHSPTGLTPELARFFEAGKDLQELMGRLARHVAADEPTASEAAKRTDDSLEEVSAASESPSATQKATDWRDVATQYLRKCDSRPKASDVMTAIQAAGLEAPSLRTIQRFISDFKQK